MKVFVIGYPKTGTKTMGVALTMLGYKVYDYDMTFHHMGKEWIRILTEGATKEDFYRMYKDVEVSCDIPASLLWEDVLEAFPEVKLIFMERDTEKWLASMQNQLDVFAANRTLKMYAWFSPTARTFYKFANNVGRVIMSAPMSRTFYGIVPKISPNVLKMRYRNHNAAVKSRAPKKQLLTFELSDGWRPLCEFLDKPIPDAPFPHKNIAGSLFDEYLEVSPAFLKMRQETKMYLSLYVAISAFVVYLIFWYMGS